MRYKITYIFLFLVFLTVSAQTKQDSLIDLSKIANHQPKILPNRNIVNEEFLSELIVFENKKLINLIESLNLNNQCLSEGEVWYLEYYDNFIILSKTYLQNLIFKEYNRMYATIIQGKLFFLLINEFDSTMKKTSFYLDISRYKNLNYTFGDESIFWYIAEENCEYKIITSKTKECYDL